MSAVINPKAIDVDLSRTGELGNAILEDLDRLREADPIHWSDSSHAWLVTRHDDVVRGFSGELPLSNHRTQAIHLQPMVAAGHAARIPNLLKVVPHWITDNDPPVHTRMRKLLVKAFSRKVVENVRPYVRDRVSLLLDKAERERDVEFVEGIARQLPGAVILELLGSPIEHFGQLKQWGNALVIGLASSAPRLEWLETADRAVAEMNDFFRPQIEDRRRHPKDDLLSALVHATEERDSLTEDELLAALSLILVAGHDTTASSMSIGTVVLSRAPEAWAQMYAQPERMLDYVNEIMRFSAMSAGQPRLASDDFEWHGKQIRKGDIVFLIQAAGNRDPRVFTNPTALDFRNENDRSLVFGPGLHHCVGHLLAKLQLTEYFGALTRRFSTVEIRDSPLNFMPAFVFRGFFSLNVRFHPRQGVAT